MSIGLIPEFSSCSSLSPVSNCRRSCDIYQIIFSSLNATILPFDSVTAVGFHSGAKRNKNEYLANKSGIGL